MGRAKLMLTLVEIIASLCLINCVQGQQYIITGPADTQYIPSYQQNANSFNNFRQPSSPSSVAASPPGYVDSYLPQRDLQTSDLPYHLQQTLPQYRITTKSPPLQYDFQSNPFNFQSSPPSPFKSSNNNIIPSTHRPNYSHLFSHLHNRNPSQTETFLGEITLQSPAELPPPRYNDFKPSSFNPPVVNQNLDHTERPSAVQINPSGTPAPRGNFLNHRTRIFAPDSTKKAAQVKDYFVNNNGEVFITTKVPFAPSTTPPTTLEPKNNIISSAKPTKKPLEIDAKPNKAFSTPTSTKNGFDLESLLEEPIKEHNSNSDSDDVVEIVKSVEETTIPEEQDDVNEQVTTLPPAEEITLQSSKHHGQEKHESQEKLNEDYEDETTLNSSSEYQDEDEENYRNSEENNDIHDEEYSDEHEEENEESDSKQSHEHTGKPESEEILEESKDKKLDSSQDVAEQTKNKTEPELVVSVVTTKSVINNTVIASVTPIPPVTQEMTVTIPSTHNEENTTDTWVVVASVQTSRSVSGARYLPSANVEQNERIKLLNEEETEENHTEEQTEDNEETTILAPTTTTKLKTSTESLIDKLDRVQSDLSSGLLSGFKEEGNNIAVITENMSDKMATTMLDIVTTPETTTVSSTTTKSPHPQVQIRKFSPLSRPKPSVVRSSKKNFSKLQEENRRTSTTKAPEVNMDEPQSDEPMKDDLKNRTTGRSAGVSKPKTTVQDIESLLPPDYKAPTKEVESSSKLLQEILRNAKLNVEKSTTLAPSVQKEKNSISSENNTKEDNEKAVKNIPESLLPPGYLESLKKETTPEVKKPTEPIEIVDPALLPPGYLEKIKKDNISDLLPPGYKPPQEKQEKNTTNIFDTLKEDDVSSLLPPGYRSFKPSRTTTHKPKAKSGIDSLLSEARPVDISAFLPPGYKAPTTHKPPTTMSEKVPTSLLPPGYKFRGNSLETRITTEATTTMAASTTKSSGFKVVFPSRPGGGARKSPNRLTTPRSASNNEEAKPTPPAIHKGWPSRATTEFTGWPTPSTTPISIEKLLEAARTASTSTTESSEETVSSTTTKPTTTTTTTTAKPTTPGICIGECDIAGTIKLVGGAKWVPELLDRNTKEWQILANEVQTQLEDVYSRSNMLNKWYKKIRIDGFSEGSVLVDYLVELNDLGRQIDTLEIKKLFHESLDDALTNSNREGKSLNESSSAKINDKLTLGHFVVDPKYTDFIVLPKQVYPTVGYAEDNVLLPQWAIAVIVIGLASLLFVIIFGVTVLVNRQKNAKKKIPTPLTDDMLNELNKNHMGGFDNYGAEDLYNMEDVWNERSYDQKLPKKRSSGSIHDNSMSNLYDSWRSEWNGYYYNAYYGNNPGSSHSGYGRRRSDYDTNF